MNASAKHITLGGVYATPGALEALESAATSGAELLARHARGDLGDVCPQDWKANDDALIESTRLFSVYTLETGVKVWVITEWDRSATTMLLPDEY